MNCLYLLWWISWKLVWKIYNAAFNFVWLSPFLEWHFSFPIIYLFIWSFTLAVFLIWKKCWKKLQLWDFDPNQEWDHYLGVLWLEIWSQIQKAVSRSWNCSSSSFFDLVSNRMKACSCSNFRIHTLEPAGCQSHMSLRNKVANVKWGKISICTWCMYFLN